MNDRTIGWLAGGLAAIGIGLLVSEGLTPRRIEPAYVGDLTGDGVPDAIEIRPSIFETPLPGQDYRVLFTDGADLERREEGWYAASSARLVGYLPRYRDVAISAADVNADGFLDLRIEQGGSFSRVYEGGGKGRFRER